MKDEGEKKEAIYLKQGIFTDQGPSHFCRKNAKRDVNNFKCPFQEHMPVHIGKTVHLISS